MPAKRIYRNQREKVLGGVAAGIADYFDIDVAWVRLGFVVALFFHGLGLIAYIVAWIVFPKDERSAAELREVTEARAQSPAPAPKPARRERSMSAGSRNGVGVILILLGLLFFFDLNFYWFDFGSYWPLILVGLGVFMIARSLQSDEAPASTTAAAGSAAGNPPESSDHA